MKALVVENANDNRIVTGILQKVNCYNNYNLCLKHSQSFFNLRCQTQRHPGQYK